MCRATRNITSYWLTRKTNSHSRYDPVECQRHDQSVICCERHVISARNGCHVGVRYWRHTIVGFHEEILLFHWYCKRTLISPLPVKPGGGDYMFPRRLSFCPSFCPSVRQSVRQSTRCPSTWFSELFSVVLWDIDLKFGIWICLHITQIKFDFGRVWLTFTRVIALC